MGEQKKVWMAQVDLAKDPTFLTADYKIERSAAEKARIAERKKTFELCKDERTEEQKEMERCLSRVSSRATIRMQSELEECHKVHKTLQDQLHYVGTVKTEMESFEKDKLEAQERYREKMRLELPKQVQKHNRKLSE